MALLQLLLRRINNLQVILGQNGGKIPPIARSCVKDGLSTAPATTTVRITQRENSRSSMKTNHQWTRINTNRPEDRWTSFNDNWRQNASALLSRWCDPVPSEEAHPGARASRPHKSSRSFSHLLHRNQPAAAPCLCFGRAHAVPAGRAVGCNIAGKTERQPKGQHAGGTPALPGGVVPMVRGGYPAGDFSESRPVWETPVCLRAGRPPPATGQIHREGL